MVFEAVFFLQVDWEKRLLKSSIYDLQPFLIGLPIQNFLVIMKIQVEPMEDMVLEMLEDQRSSFVPLGYVVPIHKLTLL